VLTLPPVAFRYTAGFNLRAAVAWPAGFWFLLPGLAQRAVEPGVVWPGWTRLYNLAWFLGFSVAAVTYLTLHLVWPMKDLQAVDDEDYFGTFGEPYVINGVEVEGDRADGEGHDEEKGGARQRVFADASV